MAPRWNIHLFYWTWRRSSGRWADLRVPTTKVPPGEASSRRPSEGMKARLGG